MNRLFVLVFLLIVGISYGQGRNEQRVLKQEYGNTASELTVLPISHVNLNQGNVKQVFSVLNFNELLGYIVEVEVKGRMHLFKAIVLLNPEGAVYRVNIVDYPSTHGVQVTNKRWLSKLRIDAVTVYNYGQNVDAISGATISSKNLVVAIQEVREVVKAL